MRSNLPKLVCPEMFIEAGEMADVAQCDHEFVRLVGFDPTERMVSPERILRIQGYSRPEVVRPPIVAAAQLMARMALRLCAGQVAFRIVPIVSVDAQGLSLAGGHRLSSPAFAHRLGECVEAVPFVLSCGPTLSQAVSDLVDSGDLLEAVLLEAAGWLCIEDITRQFKECLKRELSPRRRRVSSRMGPGYTYTFSGHEVSWPLEDHPQLFGLLQAGSLPAVLMSSCAMSPKLSRSGLFGLAPLPSEQVKSSE